MVVSLLIEDETSWETTHPYDKYSSSQCVVNTHTPTGIQIRKKFYSTSDIDCVIKSSDGELKVSSSDETVITQALTDKANREKKRKEDELSRKLAERVRIYYQTRAGEASERADDRGVQDLEIRALEGGTCGESRVLPYPVGILSHGQAFSLRPGEYAYVAANSLGNS